MNVNTLYKKLNFYSEKNDYAEIRRLVEYNLSTLLKYNYYKELDSNVVNIIKIILQEKSSNTPKLTREELHWINAVNNCARNFSISEWKFLWNNRGYYLDRPEITRMFTGDTNSLIKILKMKPEVEEPEVTALP